MPNFHEKAHFVKADVAALDRGRAQQLSPSRYASIRTLDEPALLGDSVHYEIRLLGLIGCCNLRSGLYLRMDQVRIAQSPLAGL